MLIPIDLRMRIADDFTIQNSTGKIQLQHPRTFEFATTNPNGKVFVVKLKKTITTVDKLLLPLPEQASVLLHPQLILAIKVVYTSGPHDELNRYSNKIIDTGSITRLLKSKLMDYPTRNIAGNNCVITKLGWPIAIQDLDVFIFDNKNITVPELSFFYYYRVNSLIKYKVVKPNSNKVATVVFNNSGSILEVSAKYYNCKTIANKNKNKNKYRKLVTHKYNKSTISKITSYSSALMPNDVILTLTDLVQLKSVNKVINYISNKCNKQYLQNSTVFTHIPTPTYSINSEAHNTELSNLKIPNSVLVPITTGYNTLINSYTITHFLPSIKNRYAGNIPTMYISSKKKIVDSCIMQSIILNELDTSLLRKQYSQTSVVSKFQCISPFLSALSGVPVVDTADLIKDLGYSVNSIKNILNKVRKKSIHLCLVGLGGTGINFIVWANELLKFAEKSKAKPIFKNILSYEPDTFEFSNLFRLPINALQVYNLNQDFFSNNLQNDTFNKTDFVMPLIDKLSENAGYNVARGINIDDVTTLSQQQQFDTKDYVFYGAPDLTTRKMLATHTKFISATHSNNNCSLWLKPEQNLNILNETYGVIQLNSFFMNHLKMTIEFLRLLGDGIDFSKKDELLMKFDFSDYVKETNKTLNEDYNIIDNPMIAE